jgi:hypothetical protein
LRSLPEAQQCNLVAVGSLQYKYCKHFGAFDQTGALAAYCRVNFYGNFAAVEELIGCKNRDGVMYMLLSEIVCRLINEAFLDYFMCDGFLDTKAGLRRFKRRLGFEPYRVRYATS